MKYIVATQIKCEDGITHRLDYDLVGKASEEGLYEFGRVFTEIENRFPGVKFWIAKYPDSDNGELVYIHGNKDDVLDRTIQTDLQQNKQQITYESI